MQQGDWTRMELNSGVLETLKCLKWFWYFSVGSARILTTGYIQSMPLGIRKGHLDWQSSRNGSPVASYLSFFISFNSLLIRLSRKALLLLGGINRSTSSSSDLSIVVWIVLRWSIPYFSNAVSWFIGLSLWVVMSIKAIALALRLSTELGLLRIYPTDFKF